MNIKDSNKHFEKLSSFYTQVSNDGEVNKIELDLLKSYVLNFYESISGLSSQGTSISPQPQQVVEKVVAPAVTPVAPVASTPLATTAEAPIAEQAPAENIIQEVEAPASIQSPEIEALFSLETGNEISDKLSMTPISDVTKAMNINEKIFTVKELFGGDKEIFDTTMNKLNGFSTYEEARSYLTEEVVEANGWLEASKSKKVKTFLKLIARKYV